MPLLSRANTDWVTKTGKATSYDDGWVYCSCGPLDVVAFPQSLRLDVVGTGTSILQSIIYNAHLLYSVARPVQRLRNLPIISQAVSTSRDPSGIKRTCMTARACPQDLTWKRIGSWSVMLYCVMTMLPTAGFEARSIGCLVHCTMYVQYKSIKFLVIIISLLLRWVFDFWDILLGRPCLAISDDDTTYLHTKVVCSEKYFAGCVPVSAYRYPFEYVGRVALHECSTEHSTV